MGRSSFVIIKEKLALAQCVWTIICQKTENMYRSSKHQEGPMPRTSALDCFRHRTHSHAGTRTRLIQSHGIFSFCGTCMHRRTCVILDRDCACHQRMKDACLDSTDSCHDSSLATCYKCKLCENPSVCCSWKTANGCTTAQTATCGKLLPVLGFCYCS